MSYLEEIYKSLGMSPSNYLYPYDNPYLRQQMIANQMYQSLTKQEEKMFEKLSLNLHGGSNEYTLKIEKINKHFVLRINGCNEKAVVHDQNEARKWLLEVFTEGTKEFFKKEK